MLREMLTCQIYSRRLVEKMLK